MSHEAEELRNANNTLKNLIEGIKNLDPVYATEEEIEFCEKLLSLPDRTIDQETRFTIMSKLGSFYLEDRSGSGEQWVERLQQAMEMYREARALAMDTGNVRQWMEASQGIANANLLIFDLSRERVAFDNADRLYTEVYEKAKTENDLYAVGSVLMNHANLLMKAEGDDRLICTERAVVLMRESIEALDPDRCGDFFQPDVYARALYNLGASLLNREGGVRSENIDEAIAAFKEALLYRTTAVDPKGRIRTLKALAFAYPEWTGTDSLAEAQLLAQKAFREADDIERHVLGEGGQGWTRYSREKPALYIDSDILQTLYVSTRDWYDAIEHHQQAVLAIPQNAMPRLWAEWQGGLAHIYYLCGRLNPEYFNEASDAFQAALDVIETTESIEVKRDILRLYGWMKHEIGDWQGSFEINSKLFDIGCRIYEKAGTEESRWHELKSIQVVAQLGAYAAARTGSLDAALELAENGLCRWLIDQIAVIDMMRRDIPDDQRDAIATAHSSLLDLTHRLYVLETSCHRGEARDAIGRLSDYLGLPPDVIGTRIINLPDAEIEKRTEKKKAALCVEIRKARQRVRSELNKVSRRETHVNDTFISAEWIKRIARRNGSPVVYLLSTVWGTLVLIVNGEVIEHMHAEGLNSDVTRRLAWGGKDSTGFVKAALGTERNQLTPVLEMAMEILKDQVFEPLKKWGSAKGVERLTLIGIGSIGMLPLHAAALETGLVVNTAPSARLLAISIHSRKRASKRPHVLGTVVNPQGAEGCDPLNFSIAEAAYIRSVFQKKANAVILADESLMSAEAFRHIAEKSTHLHISCHGLFRPSAPFESTLQISPESEFQLRELFWPTPLVQDTAVVNLSACSSAGKEYWEHPDEIIGFPSTLISCGTACVIGALWEVDDAATCLINYRFIQNYCRSRDASASLADAQLWLRDASAEDICRALDDLVAATPMAFKNSRRYLRAFREEVRDLNTNPFSTPEYWAAFICVCNA